MRAASGQALTTTWCRLRTMSFLPPADHLADAPTGPIPRVRTAADRRRLLGAVGGGVGIVITITGTFLPWLVSGSVQRNSYAVAGLADRLLLEPGSFGAVAVSAWPYLGPFLLLPVVVAALHRWRTAAVIALVGSVLAGVVAGLAVVIGPSDELISLSIVGPLIVLVGALLLLGAAVLVLSAGRRRGTARRS